MNTASVWRCCSAVDSTGTCRNAKQARKIDPLCSNGQSWGTWTGMDMCPLQSDAFPCWRCRSNYESEDEKLKQTWRWNYEHVSKTKHCVITSKWKNPKNIIQLWRGSNVSAVLPLFPRAVRTQRPSWLLVTAIYGPSNLWTKSFPVVSRVYRTHRRATARLIKSDLFSFAYLLNWCPPGLPDSHNFIIQTI